MMCDNCRNQVIYETEALRFTNCIYHLLADLPTPIIKCSHFKPKAKNREKMIAKRKETMKSGKEPRKKKKEYDENGMFINR